MPGLDAVSFLYGQVLTQIEYLHEQGHLSQQNYATIVGALMQASPPASPAVPDDVMNAPILDSATAMSYEPSQYAAGPSYASPSGAARPALSDPPKPTRASSSFLKFKSKSSDEKKNLPSPLPPASGNIATTTRPSAEEEEDLGKINKNIRRALQGGWILGSVVDQALAVTPFVPEAFRERVVETVEETSGEWVTKLTSPQRQAIARNNLARAGSTALQLARGGGGTSRASSTNLPTSKANSSTAICPPATANAETGTYSLIQSAAGQRSGDADISITSVHSFVASENVQITTVVTASILPQDPAKEASNVSRRAGLSPLEVNPYEDALSSGRPASQQAIKDPSIVSGHVW